MEHDIHHKIKTEVAMTQQAIGSNTTTVGAIIDTKGYESIDFVGLMGTITDGTYDLLLEEGDAANLSDAAVVPAENLHGSLFQFVAADDDSTKRTGSAGKKRYIRASIVSTGVTTGVNMAGVVAVLGHAKTLPTPE